MSHNGYYDIVIIGAGASGLLSACLLASSDLSVLVIEKENRVGRKLSATGNGRCNLTNLDMDWKKYYGDRSWISSVIEEVTPKRVISVFENLGVLTREKDGYVYPHSNQAQTVVGALYRGMKRENVSLKTGCRVTEVICDDTDTGAYGDKDAVSADSFRSVLDASSDMSSDKNVSEYETIIDVDVDTGEVLHVPGRFRIVTDDGSYECDKLLLATGGPAGSEQGGVDDGYGFLRSLGHTVSDIYPGLTGIHAAGSFWKNVAGTRVQGSFTLFVDGKKQGTDTGEIQITKTGVSGIPVFQLCRLAAEGISKDKPVWGEIDFVPSLSEEELTRWLEIHSMDGLVPEKWLPILSHGQKNIQTIVKTLKHFEFTITDTYGIDRAQVSAGGVPIDEISCETFESRIVPGLYILGELVDIDGICGGYNLHLAWSSAILATDAILSK